jgi:hypothetical protein
LPKVQLEGKDLIFTRLVVVYFYFIHNGILELWNNR